MATTLGAPRTTSAVRVDPAALLALLPPGAWATTDGLRACYAEVMAEGVDLPAVYHGLAALAAADLVARERPAAGGTSDEMADLRWRRI